MKGLSYTKKLPLGIRQGIHGLQIIIQQINNSIISQASKYISGEEIFRCLDDDSAGEAIQKIEETINCCLSFKSIFLECKSIAINQFQLKIAENEAWQNQSIDKMFQRLDVFINRCRDYWVLQDV